MQNQKSSKHLWKGLVEANLIEGDAPHLELESPWYIKLLLSISGWFGAVFLLIFIGSFLSLTLKINIESFPLLLTFLGAGLTLFSYKMFQSQNSDFLEHFFLAISLVGQVLVVISVVMMWDNKIFDKEIYLFIALGQAFLMWIIPNYIHRVMSSFFMALAWAFFFYSMGIFLLYVAFLTFVVAWLWMNEFYFESIKKVQAIAYGQLVAMVGLKASTLYADNLSDFYSYSTTNLYFQISPSLMIICSTLTLAYVVWKILEQSNKLEDKKVLLFSFLAVVLLGLLSFRVSGLVTGVMLLLIGFSSSHRLLIGLGILSSLFFISNYYYFMGESLMDKSVVLALVGTLLLSLRWVVKKFVFKEFKNV